MSKRTYGILAGVLGSAFGAWWYRRRRSSATSADLDASSRGTVIYDNTPVPSAEGII